MSRVRFALVNLLATTTLILLILYLAGGFRPSRRDLTGISGTITLGWGATYPYQYELKDGQHRLSGLDTELLRAAFLESGYRVNFVDKSWATSLQEVEAGTLDGVGFAFKNPEREAHAQFSEPYFSVRTAIFYRTNQHLEVPKDCESLRQLLVANQLTVSRTQGYSYDAQLESVLTAPLVQSRVSNYTDESATLNALITGQSDIAVVDQLSGTSLLMKNGWSGEIGCTVLDLPFRPVHVMFSKKVPRTVIERLNQAFRDMDANGTTASIVRGYYYPPLIGLLAHSFLFDQISVLAAAAAAISGIFLARERGYNLFGAFFLGAAPAAGGGLLRDVMAGRYPIAIVADPSILTTVLCLVLILFLMFRSLELLPTKYSERLQHVNLENNGLLVLFDSLGLGAFTVLGVLVALQYRCEPLWLWGPLLAVVTNGGGSVIRDLITMRPVSIVSTTIPYVEISAAWGFALSAYLIYSSGHLPYRVVELQLALLGTTLGVIVTRYIVLRWKMQTPCLGASVKSEP